MLDSSILTLYTCRASIQIKNIKHNDPPPSIHLLDNGYIISPQRRQRIRTQHTYTTYCGIFAFGVKNRTSDSLSNSTDEHFSVGQQAHPRKVPLRLDACLSVWLRTIPPTLILSMDFKFLMADRPTFCFDDSISLNAMFAHTRPHKEPYPFKIGSQYMSVGCPSACVCDKWMSCVIAIMILKKFNSVVAMLNTVIIWNYNLLPLILQWPGKLF